MSKAKIDVSIIFSESFESTFELAIKLPNIDRISLHPICRYNNVTMETFIMEGKKIKEDKSSEFYQFPMGLFFPTLRVL